MWGVSVPSFVFCFLFSHTSSAIFDSIPEDCGSVTPLHEPFNEAAIVAAKKVWSVLISGTYFWISLNPGNYRFQELFKQLQFMVRCMYNRTRSKSIISHSL